MESGNSQHALEIVTLTHIQSRCFLSTFGTCNEMFELGVE